MAVKEATIKQVCDCFNDKKGTLPIIVNVQNKADYRAVLDGIAMPARFLRLSAYFDNYEFPETNKMISDILEAEDNVVVLGLFQYFCFNGGEFSISNALSEIINSSKRIFILTYRIDEVIKKKLKADLRLKERAQILFVSGEEDDNPKLLLTKFEIKSPNFFETLKKYFLFIDENGGGKGVVKSMLSDKAFDNRIWSVSRKNSAFELLKEIDENFANLDESYGTVEQWESLIKDIKETTFKDLLFTTFGVDLVTAIKKFKTFNDTQKWHIFLWLKMENTNGYFSLISQKVDSVTSILSAVYNAILEIEVTNKRFKDYYTMRKELIAAIDDIKELKEFAKLSNAKERNKVYYLTDNSEVERKEILKSLTQYDYTTDEIRKITSEVYPLLSEYLSIFDFGNDQLQSYFEEYRIQKVKNVLTEAFKQKVEQNAQTRPFYSLLQPRAKVLSQISFDDALVYWVDALGAEFCAFINQRCKHYGLSAKIQIARAELPTLTAYNSDFYDENRGDKSIDKLDKLKHKGVGDHDYTKTKLPLYIESELQIIDEIIRNTQAVLADKKKVIILSDHGASRLVRIADNILTIDVDTQEGEKDEKHGGRCCAWNPNIPKQYNTVTDSDNNGYCVIANYDRFKGGKYTGVELHGGATLEEVVVPIIEITNKTEEYRYTLKTKELTLRGLKADPLVITLSREVANPKIKIQGQTTFILPISAKETTYIFETNIVKSGKNICTFFNDNEEIIQSIEFVVKSALGSINDLL